MSRKYIDAVTYDITMNCNLRCKHCYNANYLEAGKGVRIDVEKTINALSKIDFGSIVIQGGEPLLVENLEELVNKLSRKGVNVQITTNATLLTKDRVVGLIKAGLRGIFFSVESASGLVNDELRGKGTYELFYRNVKNFMNIYTVLLERKLVPPMRIAFSCTVSSINFKTDDDIRSMFELAKEMKISDIVFNSLQNFGASKNLEYNKDTTNLKLANSIVEVSKKFPQISMQLPLKMIEHEFLKKRNGYDINIKGAKGKCPAGEHVAYIDPELNIFPCAWLIHLNSEHPFTIENKVCLYDEVPENMFETFIQHRDRCVAIFKDCTKCKYVDNCIPVCPCVEKFSVENGEERKNMSCPTKTEMRGF